MCQDPPTECRSIEFSGSEGISRVELVHSTALQEVDVDVNKHSIVLRGGVLGYTWYVD